MYHNVGIPPKGAALKSLYVTPRMFRFQMWYLKVAGFKVVPLTDVPSLLRGGAPGNRFVSLTFDDGYKDFYDSAYPVLKKYGYPSTVFLVSDLIGKENIWDCGDVNTTKKLMDWEVIHRLKKDGVTFGSHTKTHPFLTALSPGQLEEEVSHSKTYLEEELQLPVESLCYPYGDYDGKVIENAKRAGYQIAVTVKRGLVHTDDDPFEIRRSFIRLNTHPLLFMCKLHSHYEDRRGARK